MLKTCVSKRIVRILLPLLVIAIWLGASAIGGPYFGKISEVSEEDTASFLPKNAQSTKVNQELKKFQTDSSIPTLIIFTAKDNKTLTNQQVGALSVATSDLSELKGIKGAISLPIPSEKKQAALVAVPVDPESVNQTVVAIKEKLTQADLVGVDYKITGPGGTIADVTTAFSGIDSILLIAALSIVFIILVIVYRSPLLPILVLLTSISALSAAIFVVYHLAQAGIVTVNGQVQGILFILVIGAATDYSLLYVARFKESLRQNRSSTAASISAWKSTWEPILASGGTVIAGLLCLLISQLGSNQALGPVGAIGIASAMLAALTFLPALLFIFCRVSFWPLMPRYESSKMGTAKSDPIARSSRTWRKVGVWVARYPKRLWIVPLILLLIAATGIFGIKANGVSQDEFVLGKSEARQGQALLSKYFSAGSGSPVYIVTPEVAIPGVVKKLNQNKSVTSISAFAENAKGQSVTLTKKGMVDQLQNPLKDQTAASKNPAIKIVDGEAILQVTLAVNSSSTEAQSIVRTIRTSLIDVDSSIRVGGQAAQLADTNDASIRDRTIIIPMVLVAITIILMILLRSIVAPLLLLLSTVISFAATLGISSLVFNYIFRFPGADPAVILFGFVFLVALGIDYNIFLMSRVREETIKHGTRKGVVRGLVFTGGVITSAGIVLAATFAALAVIPILFLAQLSFIVVLGVLLDTFVVRSLIVPALIRTIGPIVWWPSNLKNKK